MIAHLLIPAVVSAGLLVPLPDSERPKGYLGVRITNDPQTGKVQLIQVDAGGPADKAGLKAGDLVTHLNGEPLENFQELIRIIGGARPGARVAVKVLRGGKEQEITVRLGKRPRENPP